MHTLTFKICIVGSDGHYPFDLRNTDLGLQDLDQIRQSHPEVTPDDIFYDSDTWDEVSVIVPVPEPVVRKAGHFISMSCADVIVPANFLNQFARVSTSEYGRKGQYRAKKEPDKEAILLAWIEAGYPLKWGLPVEETE